MPIEWHPHHSSIGRRYLSCICPYALPTARVNNSLAVSTRPVRTAHSAWSNLHALLPIADGMTVSEVTVMLALGEHTVRDYINRFLWHGVSSTDGSLLCITQSHFGVMLYETFSEELYIPLNRF